MTLFGWWCAISFGAGFAWVGLVELGRVVQTRRAIRDLLASLHQEPVA